MVLRQDPRAVIERSTALRIRAVQYFIMAAYNNGPELFTELHEENNLHMLRQAHWVQKAG